MDKTSYIESAILLPIWFIKMKNNLIFILFILVWIFTIQSVLLYYYHYFNSVKLKNPPKQQSISEEVKLQKLKSKYTNGTSGSKVLRKNFKSPFIIRIKNQCKTYWEKNIT